MSGREIGEAGDGVRDPVERPADAVARQDQDRGLRGASARNATGPGSRAGVRDRPRTQALIRTTPRRVSLPVAPRPPYDPETRSRGAHARSVHPDPRPDAAARGAAVRCATCCAGADARSVTPRPPTCCRAPPRAWPRRSCAMSRTSPAAWTTRPRTWPSGCWATETLGAPAPRARRAARSGETLRGGRLRRAPRRAHPARRRGRLCLRSRRAPRLGDAGAPSG
jgi:hypothetical protein